MCLFVVVIETGQQQAPSPAITKIMQLWNGTSLSLYQDTSELRTTLYINKTLSSVSNVTSVYLTTSEMRTPHYSGHFNLVQ